LHFGLQLTALQCAPARTAQESWSSLNGSEPHRPDLLMRLG
jgi:hypothetical protein